MKESNHFVAIDFETATASLSSACAIGIVEYVNQQEVDKHYYLIKPPANYFYNSNIAIHHITPEDTQNSPDFEQLWPEIKTFFEGKMIVAHNAGFDINVLNACLEHYQLPKPDFHYFCSIQVGSLGLKSPTIRKGLDNMSVYYGIDLEEHHNALCDARACGQIILHVQRRLNEDNLTEMLNKRGLLKTFSHLKIFKRSPQIERIDLSKLPKVELDINGDNFLKGKTFVFTGEMSLLSRPKAYTQVISLGGHIAESVTSKVDILVNADCILTNKLKNALALQKRGHHISIIGPNQFIKMVEEATKNNKKNTNSMAIKEKINM